MQCEFFVPLQSKVQYFEIPCCMKHLVFFIIVCLLYVGCRPRASYCGVEIVRGDSTATARNFYDEGRRLARAADTLLFAETPDSALHLLLCAADYCPPGRSGSHGTAEHALAYDIQRELALQYEAKNLFSLQQESQHAMLVEARHLADPYRMAEARQQMAITTLADPAASESEKAMTAKKLARQALADAPRDSVAFRAETLLFLAQCCIAAEQTDSAAVFLSRAADEWADVATTDLYRLSSIYICAYNGRTDDALALIGNTSDIYTRMEAWRLVKSLAADRSDANLQLEAVDAMLVLTDSIAEVEASETTARIHALQHADALRLMASEQRADTASARALWLAILFLLSLFLAGSAWWALAMRRKAYSARMAELEALRIAAEAQEGEATVREENMQLQKRYYDHLFAILLPILNACRKKRGHIDLGEDSWHLIEENTDLVLPGFTSKLRRQNAGLTTDDVRFCCLVAMRVPNSVIAEVYAIAPASVAVRKQRMKKKFDDRQAEQSLDNYLTQYS